MLEAHKLALNDRLRGVCTKIAAGRVTAICGPNGAGKSTLIRLLAGVLEPTGGEALMDGVRLRDLHPRERAREVGYLPQEPQIAWDLSARNLVSLGRLAHGDARREPVDAALAAMGLEALADRPVSTLSGGERARALLARVLAGEKFDGTIVYALLSGEEQGLWGGKLLADTAKARGWQVRAMLNNDIVGNTLGQNGHIVADRVRVFSEGIRFSEDEKATRTRRAIGGEDDGPSRALAKKIDGIAEANPQVGLDVFAVRRLDRFGRGGDHSPFLELGFPAVRFSVGIENYDRQHQDLRTENGRVYGDTVEAMDFPYLAKVTALNVAALRELADAPAAPASVSLDGALSMDTRVFWDAVPGAAAYKVYWRRADAQDWTDSRVVTGATETLLKDVVVDDHFIGVAAVARDGAESLVTFGGMAPRK